jgi:hypothetical protein
VRFETLRDLDEAGLDVRIWCYGCGRAVDVWSGIWADWERVGRSIRIEDARTIFRCSRDNGMEPSHDVLIVAATRPPPRLWEQEVAGFFHASRKERKREKISGEITFILA